MVDAKKESKDSDKDSIKSFLNMPIVTYIVGAAVVSSFVYVSNFLSATNQKLIQLDARLERIDERLDEQIARIDEVTAQATQLAAQTLDKNVIDQRLGDIYDHSDKVRSDLDNKVDNLYSIILMQNGDIGELKGKNNHSN